MVIAEQALATPIRMSFEEFLEWADEDTWAEWVDGEVTLLTATSEHQVLLGFLYKVLDEYVRANDLGLLLFAPFLMTIRRGLPGREPDILFIAHENMARLKGSLLEGPADLVVEIVSPESRKRDREDKFREYAAGGVREYWLIDLPRRQAEFFVLDERGTYGLAPIGEDGIFRSVVLDGLWLDVNWLWQDPLPTLKAVQQAWGLS